VTGVRSYSGVGPKAVHTPVETISTCGGRTNTLGAVKGSLVDLTLLMTLVLVVRSRSEEGEGDPPDKKVG
jgi:hypothetical protein